MGTPSQMVLLSKSHSPLHLLEEGLDCGKKSQGLQSSKEGEGGKAGWRYRWDHQWDYPLMGTLNTSLSYEYFRVQMDFQSCFRGLSSTFALYSEPTPLAWQNECFTGRCSQPPSLCTSWGKQALRGCRRKEQSTTPSQIISRRRALAPCTGAGKEGTCSKKAAKNRFLCWHHLSKKRTCIHRPHCS